MESFGLSFFWCFSGWVFSSKNCSGVCFPFWSWYCKLDNKQHQWHGHIYIPCFISCWKSMVLTGINVCASFVSEFPQKRQLYLKSNTFDTVWHVEGPHSEADCLKDCVFCKFVICVGQSSICVYGQYVLFLPTAVIILCWRFSYALALFVNEKVPLVKSRDSLQNMHKSIMVSRFVWLQVNNTQFRN